MRPVWSRVAAIAGDGFLPIAIGQHDVNLPRSGTSRFESQMATVRRPDRMLVVPTVAGQLEGFALDRVHKENIEISGQSFTPRKGNERTVRAPGRADRFAT